MQFLCGGFSPTISTSVHSHFTKCSTSINHQSSCHRHYTVSVPTASLNDQLPQNNYIPTAPTGKLYIKTVPRVSLTASFLRLLLGGCSVRISSVTPAILAKAFRYFPQSLQANCEIVPRLSHKRILPYPFQVIVIHQCDPVQSRGDYKLDKGYKSVLLRNSFLCPKTGPVSSPCYAGPMALAL